MERAYREALINYQRARRNYILFEDRVNQGLRATWRIVRLNQGGSVDLTFDPGAGADNAIYAMALQSDDKVIIIDASIAPLLARVRDQIPNVEHIIVKGPGDASVLGEGLLDYDELLAAEQPGFQYPQLSENTGMAMCYTSGTTGNPKGVMYSHRSTYMHSMMVTSTANIALAETDRMLTIVPMFHAASWALPFSCAITGAKYVCCANNDPATLISLMRLPVTMNIEPNDVHSKNHMLIFTFTAVAPTMARTTKPKATATRSTTAMTLWIAMVIAGGVSIIASLKPCWRNTSRSACNRATVVCAKAGAARAVVATAARIRLRISYSV